MRVLVTGAAGFIGSHVSSLLLDQGVTVDGLDNLNDYYDPALKNARLTRLQGRSDADRFNFIRADITDADDMREVFEQGGYDRVVHLAAQAGVRHSIEFPHDYTNANVTGFLNVL
ncbi:MAG: GDP-mannose 4,6-dehydratase, partial [Phycisphaerales bacterium]|nr:GDP-mannose 4,6-dehydratase [Phycisphaerales bacterium]